MVIKETIKEQATGVSTRNQKASMEVIQWENLTQKYFIRAYINLDQGLGKKTGIYPSIDVILAF